MVSSPGASLALTSAHRQETLLDASALPLELILAIFDASEREGLVLYGLVSKSWLHMTRYRVFSKLELYPRKITSKFIQLLASPLCTLLNVVTDLYVKADIAQIERIAPHLRGLDRVVSLTVIPTNNFTRPLTKRAQFSLGLLSKITHLDIRFDFEDFTDLVQFICSFPHVEEIVIASDWTTPYVEILDGIHQPPTSLRALTIYSYHKYIIDWMLELYCIPIIPVLALHSISLDPGTLATIQRFLRWLDCGMYEMEVSFEAPFLHSFSSDSIERLLDFSDNKALRKLTIAMGELPPSLERKVAKLLLNSVKSTQLQEITLENITIDEDSAHIHEWSDVDKELATLSTKNLSIRVISDSSRFWVAQAFPQCVRLGILN